MAYKSARHAAVVALLQIQQEGGYSNIVLDEMLHKLPLSENDRRLTTRLIYGVIERRLTIDFLLNRLSSVPVIKMESSVREILRVGVYQLQFMDKTPAFAAINESVELTRSMGFPRLSGFVNGVLRAVQREGDALILSLPATDKGEELRTSCPRGWIRYWRDAYGEATARGLLDCINEAPPAYIRVNTLRTTAKALSAALEGYGVSCCSVDGLPDALRITAGSAMQRLPADIKALFYFQDIASQWCCYALQAKPGERIADVCAAPGGKSFTVAQYMGDDGYILSSDIYPHKCDVMTERAHELGIHCVQAVCRDATLPPDATLSGSFDRVICDAPCSGLGVIRRKPEIRYKATDAFESLPSTQLTILNQAAELVRPGGVLQYSTCTLRPEENQMVTAAFLEKNPSFVPRVLPLSLCFEQAGMAPSHEITLFPHIHGSDGFYIAGFTRQDS